MVPACAFCRATSPLVVAAPPRVCGFRLCSVVAAAVTVATATTTARVMRRVLWGMGFTGRILVHEATEATAGYGSGATGYGG